MTLLVSGMMHIQEKHFSKVKHEEKKKLNKVCPFLPFVLICIWKDWSWFIFFCRQKKTFPKKASEYFQQTQFLKTVAVTLVSVPWTFKRGSTRKWFLSYCKRGWLGGWSCHKMFCLLSLAYRCFKKTQIGLDQNIISDEWNSSEALGLDMKDGHPNSNAFFGRAPSLLLGLCKKI